MMGADDSGWDDRCARLESEPAPWCGEPTPDRERAEARKQPGERPAEQPHLRHVAHVAAGAKRQKKTSIKLLWFGAMIAAPSAGMCSAPEIRRRNQSRSGGVRSNRAAT
jgi:anti-sigma factor RsiW